MRRTVVVLLALALFPPLAVADTKTTTVPKVMVPGYVQTKTWSEKGGTFASAWRGEIEPGMSFARLTEVLPEPSLIETVNDEVWTVWEYVRSEGTSHWISMGPGFSSSAEEGQRLRVQIRDQLVVRWSYEEWEPGRRHREDSEWFFSAEVVARRESAIKEAEQRVREAQQRTDRVKVDFDAEFEE